MTQIEITTNSGSKITGGNIVLAAIGAAAVCIGYSLLSKLTASVTALVPFVAGGLLFATLVGSFYFLLQLLKDMRQRARFRISFWDCYTAVAVFTVMGYMATACMHAFQSTGNPLQLWNNGVFAAVGFTVVFGCARFMGELWNDDKKKG
jgi:uncharacterized protein with PQ loop repeat